MVKNEGRRKKNGCYFIIELTYINGNALRRYMLFIVAKVLFYIDLSFN